MPFTLPPEAVLKRVVHALESPRPRLRYSVTVPTYFFALARRVLPDRALDATESEVAALLLQAQGNESAAQPCADAVLEALFAVAEREFSDEFSN